MKIYPEKFTEDELSRLPYRTKLLLMGGMVSEASMVKQWREKWRQEDDDRIEERQAEDAVGYGD